MCLSFLELLTISRHSELQAQHVAPAELLEIVSRAPKEMKRFS